MRRNPATVFLIFIFFLSSSAFPQSPNGSISGIVLDPDIRSIPGAEIIIMNDLTYVKYLSSTNGEGIYVVSNLPPGPYRIQVSKVGFKTLIKPDIILNVQDAVSINFTLPIGAASVVVTVEGGAPLINTQSAAVSTVIDRNFVASLPLNGRSFNTLLQLAPGVVIAPVGYGISQFSVAGQRQDSNNFSVDGMSANFGVVATTPNVRESGMGSAQALSALGGTSSLVSVDALEEFRIETSSFAAEFGRSPGGQVSLTTRSGTSDFHGGAFEYFRNNALDANDWFANAANLARAPERHNDFGGFLGGPVQKERTFFFLSYEGARLRLPHATPTLVPSVYARTYAMTNAPALAPYLNAYPLPDDKTVTPGVYTSQFTGSYSNSATLDAGSIRVDHTFSSKFALFGRYNEAPSQVLIRSQNLSTLIPTTTNTRTLTVGLDAFLTNERSNSLRANYSTQYAANTYSLDSFHGAIPVPKSLLLGPLSGNNNQADFSINDISNYSTGPEVRNTTKQNNVRDDFSIAVRTHQMKYGADYRVIDLHSEPYQHLLEFDATSVQNFLLSNGQVSFVAATRAPATVRSQSLSLYAQDTWRATRRLTLTYGARWELAPAPGALGSTTLASWTNTGNPAQIALAPPGTSVWQTRYGNFAPRLGLAYSLTDKGDLVFRAGGGIFYDLGVGSSVLGYFPNSVTSFVPAVQLPVTDPTSFLPGLSSQPPYPNGLTYGFAPNLKVPYSFQWNVAVEKSFGRRQVLSATYVGQAGRNLLRQEGLFQPNSNFAGDFLLTVNGARSNYNALQLQYRRPLSSRLQALFNYSWSHSLDNASNDSVAGLSNTVISSANDYASSDFDVRHSLSGALTYSIPAIPKVHMLKILTEAWSVDSVIVARSGFPFNALVFGTSPVGSVLTRPDRVPGQNSYVANPNAPGGTSLNPAAFLVPATIRQGTEGRNDISGFGLSEIDLSLVRNISLAERLHLQFRAEAFNVLNHPNFANPYGFVQLGSFGLQSQAMLNQSLGGLNPLFQEGGPRSAQLSLKLTF